MFFQYEDNILQFGPPPPHTYLYSYFTFLKKNKNAREKQSDNWDKKSIYSLNWNSILLPRRIFC